MNVPGVACRHVYHEYLAQRVGWEVATSVYDSCMTMRTNPISVSLVISRVFFTLGSLVRLSLCHSGMALKTSWYFLGCE